MQAYGAGNIPDTAAHSDIFEELKGACDRGVVIVNCTQCSQGTVTESYAGGIVSHTLTHHTPSHNTHPRICTCIQTPPRNSARQEWCRVLI